MIDREENRVSLYRKKPPRGDEIHYTYTSLYAYYSSDLDLAMYIYKVYKLCGR